MIAKTTGCKGSYPFQKLAFHNPVDQTVPDAMHTIKDAIEHFFNLIIGKYNYSKIMASEKELNRFGYNTATTETGNIPYGITKDQKKIADIRACSILCPKHVDFISSSFFTKTHFNSHDWKQVNK